MVEPSTVETVRAAVEQHTNVWLAVGVAVGPLATAMLIGWGVVKFLLPYVREEIAASRKHMSDALTARGNEAADDIKAARELAATQHAAIVDRIEAKIGHLDERAKTSETLLRSLAAKIGAVVVVLMLAFALGFGGGTFIATRRPALTPPSLQRNECDEVKCDRETEYCCGNQKCCERSRRTVDEEVASKPSSSLPRLGVFASHAFIPCDSPDRHLCVGGGS
jgi:hypothetical protein